MTTPRDITADIGSNQGSAKIPMYSYERPAYILWQAVFEGLIAGGKTEKQAIEWLQSKSARHSLDGTLGNIIRDLGLTWGKAEAA